MPEYLVRLAITVEADTPSEGVEEFVQSIVASGLRSWVYRVEDTEGTTVHGYYDGSGDEIDIDAALAALEYDENPEAAEMAMAEASEAEVPAVTDIPLPDSGQETDDELLLYAQTLTQKSE